MMIGTFVWSSIYQELMLREYLIKDEVSERCLMICNLWNNTTSEGLVRYIKGLCRGSEIEVLSVTFANAGLGIMNRRRRIRAVQGIISKLELEFDLYEQKKEKKLILKVIKGYKRWLKIYKSKLKQFKKYSKDPDNQHSAIAFITLKTKEQADIVLKNSPKSSKFTRIIQTVFQSLPGFLSCCCCCLGNSNRTKIIEAAHPDDLNWNYIGYSSSIRRRSRRNSWILRIFLILNTIFVSFFSSIFFQLFMINIYEESGVLVQHVIQFAPVVIIKIINNVSVEILEIFEKNQIYLKKSKYFRGKVWRMVSIQLINYFLSVIVTVFIWVAKDRLISNLYQQIDLISFVLKFTMVKSIFDPLATILDTNYINKRFKQYSAKKYKRDKNKGEKNKKSNIYTFYPKSAFRRVLGKPEATLDIKYSKVMTVLIIDTFNHELISPPFVSIFFLILQYTTDKLFYMKRYQDSSSYGLQKTKTMINSLQKIPKMLILSHIFAYPFLAFKKDYSDYSLLYAIDVCLLALIFVPFESLSNFVLRRFFPFERKQTRTKTYDSIHDQELIRGTTNYSEISGLSLGLLSSRGSSGLSGESLDLNDFL